MAKTQKIKVLRVVSAREGFRRAGRAFSRQPTDIPLSELSKEQIAAIKAEHLLTASETEISVEVADGE